MGERLVRVSVVGRGGIVDERRLVGEGELAVGEVRVRSRGGACTLVVPPGAQGQIAHGSGAPLPVPEGALALGESARAWLQIGRTRLLVQVCEAPVERPAVLPKEVRTGWRGAMERSFTAVLLAVMALEGTAVIAVRRMPEVPLEPFPVELDEFHPVTHPAVFAPATSASSTPTRQRATSSQVVAQRDPEALREAVRQRGVLGVLGTRSGAVGELLNPAQGIGDEIARAFEQAKPPQLVAQRVGLTPRTIEGPVPVSIDPLGPGENVRPRELLTDHLRPKIELYPPSDPECADCAPSEDTAGIAAQIRQRVSGIQRCYEKALKLRPELHGRLVARFSIATTGRVSDVTFEDDRLQDAEVTGCIRRLARGWALAVQPEEPVEVAFPFVFSAGQ